MQTPIIKLYHVLATAFNRSQASKGAKCALGMAGDVIVADCTERYSLAGMS